MTYNNSEKHPHNVYIKYSPKRHKRKRWSAHAPFFLGHMYAFMARYVCVCELAGIGWCNLLHPIMYPYCHPTLPPPSPKDTTLTLGSTWGLYYNNSWAGIVSSLAYAFFVETVWWELSFYDNILNINCNYSDFPKLFWGF